MIKNLTRQFTRPAIWGFFICLFIAGVFTAIHFFIPSFLASRWESSRAEWHSSIKEEIQTEFHKNVNDLTKIIELVSNDQLFVTAIESHASLELFRVIDSYKIEDTQTLEIVDTQGNIVAWKGARVTSRYDFIKETKLQTKFVRIIQNGIRTYLTVGISVANGTFYLMASNLIELNSPISNKYIHKISISDHLSKIFKTKIALWSPDSSIPETNEFVIPVNDGHGNVVAAFKVVEQSLENEITLNKDICLTIIEVCIAFSCLFIFTFGLASIIKIQYKWVKLISIISAMWILRIAWRLLEFPVNIIGGWLFNPNLYASKLVLGLSSSLGELIITCIFLLVTTWWVFKDVIIYGNTEIIKHNSGKAINHIVIPLFVAALVLLVLWLYRGFGEALRSFVFDTIIQYDNPSEILMDGTAAFMHLNILMVCVSLFFASMTLIGLSRRLLQNQFKLSDSKTRNILFGIILINLPIFALYDDTSPDFFLSLLFFISLIVIIVEIQQLWIKNGIKLTSQKRRVYACIFVGSFLLVSIVLNQKLQLKENKEVETAAREILRPSDSWLTFIVQDGIRSAVMNMTRGSILKNISEAKANNLAFVLWAKTLLGKEGYTSALVLYDEQGNEVDRFVLGINKTEQREMLTHVFENEEDVVSIYGQTEQKIEKMYGAWTTLRDTTGRLYGSLALILSERQKMIFQDESSEPLRQYGERLANLYTREIAINKYKSDDLIYSTGRKLYPDMHLSKTIKDELLKSTNGGFWTETKINGQKAHAFFIQDASDPERIISVTTEILDIRWSLFKYLKVLFIYLLVMGVVTIFVFIISNGISLPTIGFRGKLFIGFACVTLLPLFILGYYNKQLVSERVREQIRTSLYRELNQLQERIKSYVSDDEDFIQGVDDDFCEALATEYGVDFSVYRQSSIQSSSRSELYRATLIDMRLNGNVFAKAYLGGEQFIIESEKIGSVEYAVGYSPIIISGKMAGVLAIPTLNRQMEIESELAERNVYVFGPYAVIFGIVLVVGAWLSYRFARPLYELTQAAKEISEGNLEVSVAVQSKDEIGTLSNSFNEMIYKLRTSMVELAKHERESAWREMAKQVAHEIRNPLTPIKLSIQHLRQAYKDKAPEREEILQRVTKTVIEQIDTLSKIATEFSSFAKMPETKYERLSIDELLSETINLFREVQGIIFKEHLSSSSVIVVADRDQLRGVFINLIRNAIQAIGKTGEIVIETKLEENICLIRISDTGPGIPYELLSKIFMPNFSTKTEGMGLGLAIARRVVEDHGGTISCSSQIGKGTTFEIHLPI